MKRVLVTGASGFVGRHALAPLAARGYEVHAVTSRPREPAADAVRWHRADLLDAQQSARVMSEARPTHLLHFAWYAEPGKFWRSPENFRWLEASIALLRHFRDQGGRRVVMAGTCAEYDWNYGLCSEQLTPRRPSTPYGVCKNALHETLEAFCAVEGLSGAWGRIFFLYGPQEHPARLVAYVIGALAGGGVAECTHGNQIRDFLHVEDVASAFVALLDSGVEGAVNIASGHPVALRDVVLAAASRLDARDRVRFGAIPAPEGEAPFVVADVRRLAREVGWRPRYDLESGISETVAQWQRGRNP
jgi:nucleoside-diphosphate-sugar epimerase